jgi:predicted amidohydrolase YtcJ
MLRTLILSMAVLAGVSFAQAPTIDLLILNAKIYTGAPIEKYAEAIAISGERVHRIGTTADLQELRAVRTIDAGGRRIIPGINDAHTHPSSSPAHTPLDGPPAMTDDPSWTEILARVKNASAKAPAGRWIMGEIGGAVLEDPKATRADLDPIAGGRPVILQAWHGHGAILNTAALRALNVSETEPDPPGGFYGRMPDGKTLTGLAHEYAVYGLARRLSLLAGPDAAVAAYQEFGRTAASFGITSVQAMMVSYPAKDAVAHFERAKLPIRVRLIPFPLADPASELCDLSAGMVRCSGVKFIVDGTPVERLAFMREPYSDAPTTIGRLNFPDVGLNPAVLLAARVQPMYHAVGDGAIDTLLSSLDRMITTRDVGGRIVPQGETSHDLVRSLRPRLEHADMMEPGHFDLAKKLGVVVVQNPSHFMIPEVIRARVGDRIKRFAMVKSIVAAGIPLALGSDGPLNPFLNIMFATMNPSNAAEALTVEQAVDAYTRGSAYAEATERSKGTLAPGMLADLAMLSQDIFTIPAAELAKTTSVLTVVGGRVVHEVK